MIFTTAENVWKVLLASSSGRERRKSISVSFLHHKLAVNPPSKCYLLLHQMHKTSKQKIKELGRAESNFITLERSTAYNWNVWKYSLIQLSSSKKKRDTELCNGVLFYFFLGHLFFHSKLFFGNINSFVYSKIAYLNVIGWVTSKGKMWKIIFI